jgi:hypothetical protein
VRSMQDVPERLLQVAASCCAGIAKRIAPLSYWLKRLDFRTYKNSDCNNQGGCGSSCKDDLSLVDPYKKFTGPCCQCTATCLS